MDEHTTPPVAREVVVRGEVQGVFFRDSCRGEAQAAGITGWVTNADDGSVHAHFEGPAEAVDRLVEWSRHGPRHAVVDDVEVTEAQPSGASGFEVR